MRAIPLARRQYIVQNAEILMFVGFISPADQNACPYAFKTIIAPKKDGSIKMCVDYSDFKAQTKQDSFPFPRINHVGPTLSRARKFVFYHLLIGIHQVEVEPCNRVNIAILTHCGLLVYNVMPFALCNAPYTFQRFMELVLKPIIGLGVLVYIIYLLIYAETQEQLIDLFITVFKHRAKVGMKCKVVNCSLINQLLSYVGRVVSRNGINPDHAKLDKVKQWPRPENSTCVLFKPLQLLKNLIHFFAHISDFLYKISRFDTIE